MPNTSSDFVEIITCIFAVVKHITGIDSKGTHEVNTSVFRILYYLVCLVISLLLFLVFIIVAVVLAIPKKLVEFYLSRKYGKQFGGLLEDANNLWMAEEKETKHIINVVAFIQLQTTPTEFIECLKKKIKRTQDIGFNSVLRSTLGFWYRIYSDSIVDDVIRITTFTQNEQMYRSDFEDKLNQLANKSLPQCAPFEMLVSDKPVIFCDENVNATNNFVLISRIHHSVGHGLSLLQFVSEVAEYTLTSNNIKSILTKTSKNAQRPAKFLYEKNSLGDVVNYAMHTMRDVYISHMSFFAPHDNNLLHGSSLSGEKILAFHSEKEAKYLSKIKFIKSQVDKCTFSVVMFTAISASICEHFRKYSKNVSKHMNVSYVTVPRGTFSTATLKMPICIEGITSANEDLLGRMKLVAANYKITQHSLEPLVFYWISQLCSFLPTPIAKRLVQMNVKSSLSVSNLPGPELLTIDGQPIKDVFCWTPNVGKTGVGFLILTYGGRLKITLIADKAVLPEKEFATKIVQDIFKYIDLLENEVKLKNQHES